MSPHVISGFCSFYEYARQLNKDCLEQKLSVLYLLFTANSIEFKAL